MGMTGSQANPNIVEVAKGAFDCKANPVWAHQSGFAPAIVRNATGSYDVVVENEADFLEISFNGGSTAIVATDSICAWAVQDSGSELLSRTWHIFTNVAAGGAVGALLDWGQVVLTASRIVNQ